MDSLTDLPFKASRLIEKNKVRYINQAEGKDEIKENKQAMANDERSHQT